MSVVGAFLPVKTEFRPPATSPERMGQGTYLN
jgi:hypothetical protein